MKRGSVWRYASLVFVLGLFALVLFGMGKPLLSAFVVSEEDYVVYVDNQLNKELAVNDEVRAAVILKDSSGLKSMVFDSADEIGEEIGVDKINYQSGEVFSADISKADLDLLSQNPAIYEIVKVREVSSFLQDSVGIVNASAVWNYQINSANVTGAGKSICIIDTGINFSHSDLTAKKALCNIDCINANCIENCSVTDDHGHGTFVAGIAAASGNLQGVAIGANLIGVKVLNSAGAGYEDDLKLGMEWCIENSEEYNIRVISMSLGTEILYSDYCDNVEDAFNLTASVNSAVANGIAVVAATGNQGNYTSIASPACIKNTTAVGAVTKSDTILYNRNSLTDLLAPGASINSTTRTGGYKTESGTSSSTPFVAGAFALLSGINGKSIFDVEEALKSSGKGISDSSSGLTFKRIDVYSALLLLVASEEQGNETNQTESNETQENETAIDSNLGISVSLTSPADSYNTNLASENISCSATLSYNASSGVSHSIRNITLIVWNSNSSLIYNSTTNYESSNDTTKQAVFSYSLSSAGSGSRHYWNCYAEAETVVNTNNLTSTSKSYLMASSNKSFVYDTTAPAVASSSPEEGAVISTSNMVRFDFTASDNVGLLNCKLMRNDSLANTKTSITSSGDYFNYYLTNGNYNWSIKCTDLAGNSESTNTRYISVAYGTSSGTGSSNQTSGGSGSSSGGGGGGSSGGGSEEEILEEASYTTISIADADITASVGYTLEMGAFDEARFNVYKDGTAYSHKLRLEGVGSSTALFTVESEPQVFRLGEGEEKNFSLEHSDTGALDFYVKLINVSSGKAEVNLRVAEISSALQSPAETTDSTQQESSGVTGAVPTEETTIQKDENGFNVIVFFKNNKKYVIILVSLIALCLFYFVFRKVMKYSKKDYKNAKEIKTKPTREEKIYSR